MNRFYRLYVNGRESPHVIDLSAVAVVSAKGDSWQEVTFTFKGGGEFKVWMEGADITLLKREWTAL
jgi:hypothetical protein